MKNFLNCESTKFALKDNSNVKKSIKRTTKKNVRNVKKKRWKA
jgi:hypothetical protein